VNSQHIRALKPDALKPLVVNALIASDSPLLSADTYSPQSLPQVVKGSQADLFLTLATKIAQRDMELLTEANKFVGLCLKYEFQHSLENDKEILEVSA
jgi:hypothetical protein